MLALLVEISKMTDIIDRNKNLINPLQTSILNQKGYQ